jgi:hypothetical protein
MNNQDLDQLLKSAAPPDCPPEFWEQLPKRITARIHWQSQRKVSTLNSPRRFDRVGLALSGAVVVAVLVVLFLWQSGSTTRDAGGQLARAEKCYWEVESLFPRQVQAIILDEHGPRLVLADQADVPVSPPLYLRICGPRGCQEVVTFSGQQIRVNGDDCDVLVDAAGHVLLVGSKLVWSSASRSPVAGPYQIEARMMHASS